MESITAAVQLTARMFALGSCCECSQLVVVRSDHEDTVHLPSCLAKPYVYLYAYELFARCHTDVKEAHWSFKGFHSFHIHALVDNEYGIIRSLPILRHTLSV